MHDPSARLSWKFEDGPEDAEDEDPADVGPAWIERADGTTHEANGGEWITRAEARRLAAAESYRLMEDG
jgi:hypothetical protein